MVQAAHPEGVPQPRLLRPPLLRRTNRRVDVLLPARAAPERPHRARHPAALRLARGRVADDPEPPLPERQRAVGRARLHRRVDRDDDPPGRDRALGQHHPRPGRDARRAGAHRCGRAPHGHPVAAQPGVLDHARPRRRLAARDDRRLRHSRGRRRAGSAAGAGAAACRPGPPSRRQDRDRGGLQGRVVLRLRPQLAACVWIGYPQAEIPMQHLDGFAPVVGGSVPARIWHDFMVAALPGQRVRLPGATARRSQLAAVRARPSPHD
jgi:hypothetical protein